MSEDKSRFKIRKGDIEIEYEGKSSEVTERYKEAFEWIKTATVAPPKPEPTIKPEKKDIKKRKEDKRGGRRTSVVSPAIDELIKEGFFDDFKNSTEVLEELRRKAVPVSSTVPVNMALGRRVPKKLDRIKDTQGRWVYRKKAQSEQRLVSFDISKLSDKERRQYFTLEALFDYSFGTPRNEEKILGGIAETIDDWQKMMGGKSNV